VIFIAFIVAGVVIAAVLDWAIYTHLSAYLRAGFRLERHLDFTDLLKTKSQKARFSLVIASGLAAGVAFANPNPALWLVALTAFLIGHALLYLYLFER
jgi:hypothetical protein